MESSNSLPAYAGYAIGNLIEKKLVESYLSKQKLEAKLQELEKLRNEIKELESQKSIVTANGTELEQAAWTWNRRLQGDRLTKLENDIRYLVNSHKVQKNKNNKEEESLSIRVEESLPIDRDRVKIRSESASFASECFTHIVLEDNCDAQEIQKFVSNLLSQADVAATFPKNAIYSLGSQVKRISEYKKHHNLNIQLSLVGSCITLNRVRSYEPIIFTKNSDVSPKLKEECDNYYVLSEAVMGGIFIGLGKSISTDQGQGEDKDLAISKYQMCDYVSLGAIPLIKDSKDKIDMWSVFSDWKESLKKNDDAGFPIRFKFRELRSVLEYNKIKDLPEKSHDLFTVSNPMSTHGLIEQPKETKKGEQTNRSGLNEDQQLT